MDPGSILKTVDFSTRCTKFARKSGKVILITEFIKEGSPFYLPVPLPDYDRSILYPAQSVSEGCSSKIGADEVNDDGEGEVWQVHDDELLITDK